jgi:hypothetical protein
MTDEHHFLDLLAEALAELHDRLPACPQCATALVWAPVQGRRAWFCATCQVAWWAWWGKMR